MSGKTAGQLAYEAWRGDDDASGLMPPWRGLYDGDKTRWERIAPAVETEQLRLAREDRDQLRKRVLDLAAKWDATAARNQRNGQSLIDQGDEYGNEGLAVAEALGACVIELRHAAGLPS